MFVIRVENGKRDELKTYLMENDIESGISYIPCHHFTYYSEGQCLPETEKVYEEVLCLPMHFDLSFEDIDTVCTKIKEYLAK